jgi:hypothetical protein
MAHELQNAIDLLDATELPNGDYVYFADETRRWYVVDSGDMADLSERLDREEPDAYSLWCAATDSREMPEGWTPDAAQPERTDAAWWVWHDADQSRWSSSTAEAEERCAAWVRDGGSDGPELTA